MQKGLKIFFLIIFLFISLNCESKKSSPDYKKLREQMVENQIEARGIKDKKVFAALKKIERHKFVPSAYESFAYADGPLPIGEDQTISQPYIVALMTELLKLKGNENVLEIGTGSGYQAAVLAEIAGHVYTIEIIKNLAKKAKKLLKKLGYKNITVKHGDGYKGWKKYAPFDGIIVTAAPENVPEPLKQQLKIGGKMVIPVGKYYQQLMVITRTKEGFKQEIKIPVRFVPMTGEVQKKAQRTKSK